MLLYMLLVSLNLLDTGAGGLTVANQIYDRFKTAGKPLNEADIVVVDAADYHYYQVRKMKFEDVPTC